MYDKAFSFAQNPEMWWILTWTCFNALCRIFDKLTSGSGIKNANVLNKKLAEEFHKPIINLEKEK